MEYDRCLQSGMRLDIVGVLTIYLTPISRKKVTENSDQLDTESPAA